MNESDEEDPSLPPGASCSPVPPPTTKAPERGGSELVVDALIATAVTRRRILQQRLALLIASTPAADVDIDEAAVRDEIARKVVVPELTLSALIFDICAAKWTQVHQTHLSNVHEYFTTLLRRQRPSEEKLNQVNAFDKLLRGGSGDGLPEDPYRIIRTARARQHERTVTDEDVRDDDDDMQVRVALRAFARRHPATSENATEDAAAQLL